MFFAYSVITGWKKFYCDFKISNDVQLYTVFEINMIDSRQNRKSLRRVISSGI